MKRVLIITYYWPPTGGSGVQRWLKFAKYLPEFGWEPVIYTPENPDANATDKALLKDILPNTTVIKTKITEPYGFYKKFTGQKKGTQIKAHLIADQPQSLKQRISMFIRGNFFIPDPRCWWIRPSVKFLKKYLSDNHVDMIVSTGPPHSMHLIAQKVSKAKNIKWVADFRDPWTEIFYFNQMKLTSWARNKHLKLEQGVLNSADDIVVVTKEMQQSYQQRTNKHVSLITNGFDPDDFKISSIDPSFPLADKTKFNIVYTGLFSENRNTDILWKVLGKKSEKEPKFKEDLRITVMGQIDEPVVKDLLQSGLGDNFTDLGYVPHAVATTWQKDANVLLLALMKGKEATAIITGKFFEYIASGTPTLAFGPVKGDLGDVMRETQSGAIIEFDDYQSTENFINSTYSDFLNNDKAAAKQPSEKVMKYSRKNLCCEMVKIFDNLCK